MKIAPATLVVSAALLMVLGAVAILGATSIEEEFRESQVVPLAFARKRGADQWPDARITAFMQDPRNRIKLSDTDIRERDGSGADEWLPKSAQCRYLDRFVAIVERYELAMNPQETRSLLSKRQRCVTQFQ